MESILIAIAGIIVSGIVGAWAGLAAYKRVASQNTNDDASAVSLFEQAAANRQKENDQLRKLIDELTKRMQNLELAVQGPFRIILEFTTSPELKINRAEIELLIQEKNLKEINATARKGNVSG